MTAAAEDPREIMEALARGDRLALMRLIARFGPGLRRYASGALHQPSEAEDVVQELFLRAWKHAGRYDPAKGAASTWLYRMAVNLCIDHNRRTRFRRFVGLEEMPEPEDETPGAEDGLAARQRLGRVREAIAELPDRQRRAILLKTAGELSTAEIAAALSISPGAVEQLLVRARAALRKTVDGEDAT